MSDCICSSVEHCSYHYCDEHQDEPRPCFVCGYNERQAELRKAEKERDRYEAVLRRIANIRLGGAHALSIDQAIAIAREALGE